MLSLSFKNDEAVQVGDDIVIYVHNARRGKVQLAFEADRRIQINRLGHKLPPGIKARQRQQQK